MQTALVRPARVGPAAPRARRLRHVVLLLVAAALAGSLAILPPFAGGDLFPHRTVPQSAIAVHASAPAATKETKPPTQNLPVAAQPATQPPTQPSAAAVRPTVLVSRLPSPVDLVTMPAPAVEPSLQPIIPPAGVLPGTGAMPAPAAAEPVPPTEIAAPAAGAPPPPRQSLPLETELIPAAPPAAARPDPMPDIIPLDKPAPATDRHG